MRLLLATFLTTLLMTALARLACGSSKAHGDDLIQDYVSAKAWSVGENPYSHLPTLRTKFYEGYNAPEEEQLVKVNPHPPLSILVVLPLVGLPFFDAFPIYQLVQIVCLSLAWNWMAQSLGLKTWWTSIAGGAFGLWTPIWQGLDWGQPLGMLALETVAILYGIRKRQSFLTGAILGLACTHRPFLVILAASWFAWPPRKWGLAILGAVVSASLVFAVIGITPWGWFQKALGVSHYIDECGTIPGVLGLGTSGGLALYGLAAGLLTIVARYTKISGDGTGVVGIASMLLLYPLAWYHYDVVGIPAVLFAFHFGKEDRVVLFSLVIYLALRTLPNTLDGGPMQLWLQVIGRLGLLVATIQATRLSLR